MVSSGRFRSEDPVHFNVRGVRRVSFSGPKIWRSESAFYMILYPSRAYGSYDKIIYRKALFLILGPPVLPSTGSKSHSKP